VSFSSHNQSNPVSGSRLEADRSQSMTYNKGSSGGPLAAGGGGNGRTEAAGEKRYGDNGEITG
jgi:hypothetical protein